MRFINSKKSKPEDLKPSEIVQQVLSTNLQENLDKLKFLVQGCSDVVIKDFKFGHNPTVRGIIVYFDGLVDKSIIELNLLKPLMLEMDMSNQQIDFKERDIIATLQEKILSIAELKTLDNLQELCHHISSGDTVLLVDGYALGLVASTRSWQGRPIQTPENEVVIFGPKEGFCETLRFNTALLRRRIKSTNFKIESMVIGRITKTDVVLCYIDQLAPPELIKEVKARLEKIDIDGVLDTSYLIEFIADDRNTMFTQAMHTEKPDRVCGNLLEGRLCIMVDGSPMALILPISFPQYWTSSEDYSVHYVPASLFRILRFMAFWVALLLPSIYVAIITYHHEMIPTPLLLTIAATRQGVPFPAFIEALVMDVTFELLREAGLRLPRAVGPAVSIVGALIIGDAAVKAGLVSTPMVVIIAFTGIASFVSPSYNAAIIIRIARFGFLIIAGVLGFLGIMVGLVLMITRMASLSSFGLPYLSPLAPFNLKQITDVLVRRPWFNDQERPYLEGMQNQVRQGDNHEK
ncbi:MAG: spore germination protein [Firmicutes bacterium HGW-Firmicutes-15]|nr:MAG: spore germination protein [Firmicutes bacterium HGW-Firmicutes-15]